ncbi:unnamed protein product [Musa textilis]
MCICVVCIVYMCMCMFVVCVCVCVCCLPRTLNVNTGRRMRWNHHLGHVNMKNK